MSTLIEARVPAIGITGLNPRDGGWPEMEGLKSFTIGTSPQYPNSVEVSPAELAAHDGRLARSLGGLINGGYVTVSSGGRALSAADLLGAAEEDSAPRSGQIPVSVAGNITPITGAWTEAFDADVTNAFQVQRAAAAAIESAVLNIPGTELLDASGAGRRPTGFRLVYSVNTADVNDVNIEVFQQAQPVDGSAPAPVSISTGQTYDSEHMTPAQRGDSTGAPEYHTLEATFDPALTDFLNAGDTLKAIITVDGTATGLVTIFDSSLLYQERI